MKRRIKRNVSRARIVFAVAVLSAWMLAAVGCQTVQGFGRDVTSVGEAGEQFLQGG